MKAKLYYFEFCDNSLGIWNRRWALTEEAAEKEREEVARNLGVRYSKEDIGEDCGEYGDVLSVQSVEVELTEMGLLRFADQFATEPLGD